MGRPIIGRGRRGDDRIARLWKKDVPSAALILVVFAVDGRAVEAAGRAVEAAVTGRGVVGREAAGDRVCKNGPMLFAIAWALV